MKPPCVLVYTAGTASTYNRIHEILTSILPPSVYTIFNISSEAIRKPHWIEPSSACLLLSDTRELDDIAWKQMQSYFNEGGKMIFAGSSNLSKNGPEQQPHASLLRLVFGEKAGVPTSKGTEAFFKTTLETISMQTEVDCCFPPLGGLTHGVRLSKTQDSPMMAYMRSESAKAAVAAISLASIDQVLAPGSRIMAEAMSSIGVKVEEEVKKGALSIGYFISDEKSLSGCKSLQYGKEVGDHPKLFMRRHGDISDNSTVVTSQDLLPIEVFTRDEVLSTPLFDSKKYYDKLKTNNLGKNVLFIPVTTTTIDVCKSLSEALPGADGLCVIARQQLKGQGRGGNEFISPIGVAMFNFTFSLPSTAALAKCPSFIQHVACVAMTAGVHELSGIENFPLRIKWPNDFYFNRTNKIGGMLVSANCRNGESQFSIGIGLNVSNSLPTACLNDMLPPNSVKFSIEEVIAMALNKFEYFVNIYENKGQTAFLEHYYKYWLHTREEVLLGEKGEKVVIRGLDKYGFLECSNKANPDKLYSVADNGNTFDMMKGMIRMKMT